MGGLQTVGLEKILDQGLLVPLVIAVVCGVALAFVVGALIERSRRKRETYPGLTSASSLRGVTPMGGTSTHTAAPAPQAAPAARAGHGGLGAMLSDAFTTGPVGIPPGWVPLAASAHLAMEWRGVPFSLGGDAPTVSRAVTGSVRGFEAVAFEYTTLDRRSGGDSIGRGHSTMHVVAVRLPVVLPTLEVSAEGLTGFLTRGFAGPDFQVGDPAFDAAFRVSTGVPHFAQEVLGPELRQWLLAGPRQPWRIEGRDVLTWRQGGQSIPRVLEDADRLATIAAAVPLHVLRAHGFSGGSA